MCDLYRIIDNQMIRKGIWQLLILLLIGQVENTFLPVISYQRENRHRVSQISLANKAVIWRSPYMYYCAYVSAPANPEEKIVTSVEEKEPETNTQNGDLQEVIKEIPPTGYLEEMLQENENCKQSNEAEVSEEVPETEVPFCEQELPCFTYDWSQGWTEDDLRSEFFAVDSSTVMQSKYLSLDDLLNKDLTIKNEGTEKPQILIYHTHGSEAFLDSVAGDPSTTILGAGERLATLLEGYGFSVMHHTGIYDEHRDKAYDVALPAVEKILEENPSIQVVIDLHRDEMAGDRKLVMDLQGRPTARFMFFNGLSYSRKKGEIDYLKNPYIQENLAFSFQAQVTANEYYPGIARKIYLKAYRYNMHLCPRSMLIELGAQNNTVEEIQNACEPLAHILAIVLGKMV